MGEKVSNKDKEKKDGIIFDATKQTDFCNHILKNNGSMEEIIPIGILPGLNENIDTTLHEFEQDLMHNFTFTDLSPVTYNLKLLSYFYGLLGADPDKIGQEKIDEDQQKKEDEKNGYGKVANYGIHFTEGLSKKLEGDLYEYHDNVGNTMNQYFGKALQTYFGKNFINYKNNKCVLRLIGSQDSVYSETLQNRFGENNIVDDITNTVKGGFNTMVNSGKGIISNLANFKIAGVSPFKVASHAVGVLKELPKYNYDFGMGLMKDLAHSNSLSGIFTKELLGLQIALPRVFESSNYTDSLNIFLRLTSPTGLDRDIRTYILTPLITILTAGAPFSFDGITYGYPPLWEIKSYGNAFQSIGVLDVITITRGSMETTYSDNLEPLAIDVRITLSSLNQHFATIMNGADKNNLIRNFGIGFTNAATIDNGIEFNKGKPKIISLNI